MVCHMYVPLTNHGICPRKNLVQGIDQGTILVGENGCWSCDWDIKL
jgi:hypothetical protein